MSPSNKKQATARSKKTTFLGLPGSWKYPGFGAIFDNMWNVGKNAAMFPPKVWGFGWSFNFGYAHIPTKPLWKRCIAFLIGLVLLLAVIYALVCLVLFIYYSVTPEPTLTLVLNPPTP